MENIFENKKIIFGIEYDLIKKELLGMVIPAILTLTFNVLVGICFVAFACYMLTQNNKKEEAIEVFHTSLMTLFLVIFFTVLTAV